MSKYNTIRNLPLPQIEYDETIPKQIFYFTVDDWYEAEALQEELVLLKSMHKNNMLVEPLDFTKIPFTTPSGRELISEYPYIIGYGINKAGWLKIIRFSDNVIKPVTRMRHEMKQFHFFEYFELVEEFRGINLMKKYLI